MDFVGWVELAISKVLVGRTPFPSDQILRCNWSFLH